MRSGPAARSRANSTLPGDARQGIPHLGGGALDAGVPVPVAEILRSGLDLPLIAVERSLAGPRSRPLAPRHRPIAAVHPGHCRRRLCPRLCLLLGLFPFLGTILLPRLRKRLVDPLQGSLRFAEEVGRPHAQEAPPHTPQPRPPPRTP